MPCNSGERSVWGGKRGGCLHSPPSSIPGHREHISSRDGLPWGSNQDYLRDSFSGLTWFPEFCRRLLGPSALFSGEGVLHSPRQGSACHCLSLENSLTPCIIPASLQIGCPKPLALQQTHIARPPGQVERLGEESGILWRLRCWQGVSSWTSVCFHPSPLEISSHRADSACCL